MVQGEKYSSSRGDITFGKHSGKSDESKRIGFMALQKHVNAKTTTNTAKTSSGSPSNWGPFKDRNDFVNMHFC